MSKAKLLTKAIDLLTKGVVTTGGLGLGYAGANIAFPKAFGQDAKTTLKRDGDKYEFDPLAGENGAYRVERGFIESIADKLTGREEDIQKLGKANRRQAILDDNEFINKAVILNPKFKETIKGDGDVDAYNAEALKNINKSGIIDDIANTNLSTNSREQLFNKDINALRALKTKLEGDKEAADLQRRSQLEYNLQPNVDARRIANDDRRIAAENRLDLLRADLADRQFQQAQAQNNFQLQMGQMNTNNRRLDIENARSNRRDQREALALILQGLGNVTNNLVNY